jgi:hypothetical protein
MKQFLFVATILLTTPIFAQTKTIVEQKVYRPFTYETPCVLEAGIQTHSDTCKVVETREKGGALRTRNIYSNKYGLTIKRRFDKEKGYMTLDSHNKFEYKWEYKVGGNQELGVWTYVMPGFLVQNVSWD